MMIQDYKLLIYESLTYPNYAKADFFRKKQKESGYSMETFIHGLVDALELMINYLNSRPPEVLTPGVTNSINVYLETGRRMTGTISRSSDLAPVKDAIQELLNELKRIELLNFIDTFPDPFPKKIESKPYFKPEFIDDIFTRLKDFFSPADQERLKELLSTGNHTAPPLIFNDNGNRLADVFKKLKEADKITGVQKKELEDWIRQNFQYKHRGRLKKYSKKYLNDIISTDNNPCKNPISLE